jgi:hypothetical protein
MVVHPAYRAVILREQRVWRHPVLLAMSWVLPGT